MSTQSQTDELMVRSLRFNSSTGDNLIDVSAQFNHSDEWLPFNMDVLSPTTLQKAATAGNGISLTSGSYTNAQFYIASTNGNNVRTAFYANEQGGAIQVFDNNGMAPLNLQPQGGVLNIGASNMALDGMGLKLNVPFLPGNVEYAPHFSRWDILTKDSYSGKMQVVPSEWMVPLTAGASWIGGINYAQGYSSGIWIGPGNSGYMGFHTGGGLGTGSTALPQGMGSYAVNDCDHILFSDGNYFTQIELPSPYFNDGRELKFIVSQAFSGGKNYQGSQQYIGFIGDYLPVSFYYANNGNVGWPNAMTIFPNGQNDDFTWGYPTSPIDVYCDSYGNYPPTFSLTIKSTYMPNVGEWYWTIVDQSY